DRDADALLHGLDERGRARAVHGVDAALLAGRRVGDPEVPGDGEQEAAVALHAQHHDRVGALAGDGAADEGAGVGIVLVDALAAVGPDDQVVGAGTAAGREDAGGVDPLDAVELPP